MKKWVSLFLAFAMLFALSLPVFAAESEALAGGWNTPFIDVADWAKPYVGYAFRTGCAARLKSGRRSPE